MASTTPDRAYAYELTYAIKAAWALEPHPGELALINVEAQDSDASDIAQKLGFTHWKDLDDRLLHEEVFSLLSPVGMRYYLPAWLCYCLDVHKGRRMASGTFAGDAPILTLVSFALDEFNGRRTPLSVDQMRCVHDCLEFVRRHPKFYGLDEVGLVGDRQEPMGLEVLKWWNHRIAAARGRGVMDPPDSVPDSVHAGSIILRIEAAWATESQPGQSGLLDPRDQDLESNDIARMLGDTPWKELNVRHLQEDIFNCLSPVAIRYYLPAWLCYCIDVQKESSSTGDFDGDFPSISLISFLLAEPDNRRVPMSIDQMKCLRDCLVYMRCYVDFYGLGESRYRGYEQAPLVLEAIQRWGHRIAVAVQSQSERGSQRRGRRGHKRADRARVDCEYHL